MESSDAAFASMMQKRVRCRIDSVEAIAVAFDDCERRQQQVQRVHWATRVCSIEGESFELE